MTINLHIKTQNNLKNIGLCHFTRCQNYVACILHRLTIVLSHFIDLFDCLLLFYAMATVFQLYYGGDMMYELRRRKFEPTRLTTQGICNLLYHVGMV